MRNDRHRTITDGHRRDDGGRSVWSDMGLLFAGQAAAQICNLVALVLVARWLGQESFGVLQLAVAVGGYALVAAEMGLFTHGIRSVARESDMGVVRDFASVQTTLLAGVALVAVAVLWPLFGLLPAARDESLVFFLFLLAVIPQSFMHDWLCLGLGWTGLSGAARALRSAAYLAGVCVLVLVVSEDREAGLVAVAGIFLISIFVGNGFVGVMLHRRLGAIPWPRRVSWSAVRARVSEAWPIGGGNLIRRTLYGVDVVLLGVLAGAAPVGAYAAVVKLGFVLVVGVEVALGTLTPRLARAWSVSRGVFRDTARRQLYVLLGIAFFAGAAGMVFGPPLLERIYGAAFHLDPVVIRMLAAAYPLLGLGVYFHEMQIAADRQRKALVPLAVAAVTAVLTCVLLIPEHEGRGAAAAMLLADGLYVLGGVWTSRELWRGGVG